MGKSSAKKRNYSAITLEEALRLLGRDALTPWRIEAPPRPASAILIEDMRRLEVFDLENSEQAKTLLIDALFLEVVSAYPALKIWKAAPLHTDSLTGVADYLMAPRRAYVATPLLCVTEAKRDDFDRGRAQCLAEMHACRWNNQRDGRELEVYGIVSNGQGWRFYRLDRGGDIHETNQYGLINLPELLGALDHICAACVRNISQ